LKDIKDAGLLRRFIAQYPASQHRREAQERLKGLEQTNVAVTLPTRPTEVAKPAGSPCGGAAAVSLASWRGAGPLSEAEECGLKPKDVFQECGGCPEMVVVPAGSFTMGSPEGGDEGPQHVVTIGKPFAVGTLHVKVHQFAAYVQETGSSIDTLAESLFYAGWFASCGGGDMARGQGLC
jgi:formylglycine-generating enzyme required for sulfatase activity